MQKLTTLCNCRTPSAYDLFGWSLHFGHISLLQSLIVSLRCPLLPVSLSTKSGHLPRVTSGFHKCEPSSSISYQVSSYASSWSIIHSCTLRDFGAQIASKKTPTARGRSFMECKHKPLIYSLKSVKHT